MILLTASDIAGSYTTHFLSLLLKMFLVQPVAQLAAVRKCLSRDVRFLDHGSPEEHSAYSRNKELPLTGALRLKQKNSYPFPYNFYTFIFIFNFCTLVLKLLKVSYGRQPGKQSRD